MLSSSPGPSYERNTAYQGKDTKLALVSTGGNGEYTLLLTNYKQEDGKTECTTPATSTLRQLPETGCIVCFLLYEHGSPLGEDALAVASDSSNVRSVPTAHHHRRYAQ